MNKDYWKGHAEAIGRMTVTAILTVTFIILALQLVYGHQATEERETATALLESNRAVVCVLSVPVTEDGRAESVVNSVCLVPNHQTPFDLDGDGFVEYAERRDPVEG